MATRKVAPAPPRRPARSAVAAQKARLERIRGLVVVARQSVVRGVDLVQVQTSFQIGRHIVEHEQRGRSRAGYGEALLDALAERLAAEFGKGYSRSNLAYMRSFYLAYEARAPIVQTASGQSAAAGGAPVKDSKIQTLSGQSPQPFGLSWSHYVFLLSIQNADERDFYEIEATSLQWTLRELRRQFDSSLYERLALSRDKEGIRRLARQGQAVMQPADLLKDPLVLEFLGLDERERFDRHVKMDGENPTVGIVLCKKKNQSLVEITLPPTANIHAREYRLYLPSKKELQKKLEQWAEQAGQAAA